MQTELYILNFNYFDLIWLIGIPLIVAIGIVRILMTKSKKNNTTIYKEMATNPILPIFFIIFLSIMIITTGIYLIDYFGAKKKLNENNYLVVEGYVEDFIPGEIKRNKESFTINGILFEYSDTSVSITSGYQKYSSKGGVITHNGQHLLIKYLYEPSWNSPMILYIAEINDSN